MIYPLIQFGSVYATDDNLSSGSRYITEITGLEAFQVDSAIGVKRALDGTIYSQTQAVKDALVVITFPLIDTTKYDAIRDVVQAAITAASTYTLSITSDMGNFTFTAKPADAPIAISQTILSGKVSNFIVRQYCST